MKNFIVAALSASVLVATSVAALAETYYINCDGYGADIVVYHPRSNADQERRIELCGRYYYFSLYTDSIINRECTGDWQVTTTGRTVICSGS